MSGGGKDPNKAAIKQQKRQMARLDAIDLPELEEYILQSPELVGLLGAEELGDTSFEKIQEDESLRQAQLDALRQMQEMGEVGLTPEERAQRAEMLRESAAQGQAAQKQILQSMAERGNLDSGASLIAQLQANAQQGMDARRQSEQMAADVAQRRRDAINRASGMAGQMSQQDLARQTNLASARDRISQFNAAQRAQTGRLNLAAQQNIENQQAAIANQQAQVQNQLNQQRFQNELSKATGQGQVASNMSQIAANAPQKPGMLQAGLAGAATGASIGSAVPGVGTGIGAAVGAGAGVLSSMFEDGGIAMQNGGLSSFEQAFAKARREQGAGGEFEFGGKKYSTNYANETAPRKMTESEQDKESEKGKGIAKGLSALSNMLKPAERGSLELGQQAQLKADNIMQPLGQVDFQNPFMAEDGGLYDDTKYAQDGTIMFDSDGEGSIVGGDSFERDRVDARLNSGEAVLNVAQQQRLMDLIRGKESADSLGDEDIVEGVPKDYQEDLKNKIDNEDKMSKGLKRLIEALGE